MNVLIVALLGASVDSGVIALEQGGRKVGEEKFEITRTEAGFEEHFESTFGGLAQKGVLRTDAKWRPQSGEFEALGKKLELRREKDGLLALAGQKESKPSDLFIGNNMLAQLTPLCTLAGPAKRSLTMFPGLPVELAPAEPRGKLTFVRTDFASMVRVEILCDGARMLAFRQPLQAIVGVRVGSESAAKLLAIERKKPALPAALIEESRKVAADGASLGCSLLLPKQRSGKLPAVVFVTGSGAQDRDEDTPGSGGLKLSIFKTLAIALAEAGIASLRCDDRGVGESTGSMAAATLDTFTGDVRTMVAALRREAAIDPERVGIIGHSEGGVIAPAVSVDDARVRALVLMAGTGRPLDQVIFEQIERAVRASGASEVEVKKALDLQRRTTAAIRDGKPLPAELDATQRKQAEAATPWLRSHFRHDPAATIAKVRVPVLIAQGGKDTQVSLRDAEILRDAAKNAKVTFRVYPELNHLFAKAQTGEITEYTDPNARVDDAFIRDLVTFLRGALTPPAK